MKKFGLICLIMIVALGSVGMTYAAWSRTLTVNSSVKTGTFDVVFNSFSAPSGSNGATFSAVQVDAHTYTLTCNNLYPGLDGTFNFTLKGTGSVPAKITHYYLKQGSNIIASDPAGPLSLKLDGDNYNDISVTISGLAVGTVIPANGASLVSGSLKVHTWQSASDGNDATASASGIFTLEIDTQQQY
jgi:predicted ribosomally synthesized peptide with SipW-like signal peptide